MSTGHKTRSSERGQAIAILVLALIGLMAAAALAVDGGRLYSSRRAAQNGADNAALAGARAICYGENVTTKTLAAAAQNGFNNDGSTNTVTVSHPPASGPYSGNNEYVQVTISFNQPAALSRLVFSGTLAVKAQAIARCQGSFDYAVVALDQSNEVRGLSITGDGNLTVNGGGVISNSTHPTQAIYEEGSGTATADPIHTVGGVWGNGYLPQPPVSGVLPVADPLASVDPPTQPAGSCVTADFSGGGDVTLDPGLYCEITADSNINIFLNPGIYYIDGPGGLSVTSNASITGNNVMIYLSETASGMSLIGNGTVNITAPISGPYAGLLLYVDRNNANSVTMTGNASWNGTGTIYAPSSNLDLSGNGASSTFNSMIIARTITLGGNGNVVVNYDHDQNLLPPISVWLVE